MIKPRISIIIPAYNEEKYIGTTLESVEKAKKVYEKDVEVIVVNNNSTDATEKIAKSFGAKVVFEEERRIASVRNKGASVANGDILAFLDADSTITPNMFALVDEVMSSGKYIGGGTDVKLDRTSLGIFCTYCITKFPFEYILGIMVGLIFIEKKTFQELGGFDESLYCAEDSKFVLDLKSYAKKKGKKFKVITSAYVTSSARSFDKHGDWYYFKLLHKFLLHPWEVTKDKDFCKRFWYDVR